MTGEDFSIKELLVENRKDTKKLLSEMSSVKEHLKTLNGRVGKSENSVELLKKFQWGIAGAAALAILVIKFVIK